MDARLTDDEIMASHAGDSSIKRSHRKVADAQLRKALWWVANDLIDKSEAARPHNWDHGKAILAVAEQFGRDLHKANIEPWLEESSARKIE